MEQYTLRLPEGFESSVELTRNEFEQQVRLMAALKMFELGKLSSGMAARLAGMSRIDFLDTCSQYEIPVTDASDEELAAEVARLEAWQN